MRAGLLFNTIKAILSLGANQGLLYIGAIYFPVYRKNKDPFINNMNNVYDDTKYTHT